ncbi:MAG TPA: hypothetical protein PLN78_03175, partial [Pseudomonadales bacterium]|nr:hypothetical protein [Pseudomonadales bacterium]
MLTLAGAPALSPFRLERLLAQLRALDPGIDALGARFMYFVETSGALAAQELQRLCELVDGAAEIELDGTFGHG